MPSLARNRRSHASGVGAFLLVFALVGVAFALASPAAVAQLPTYDGNGVRAKDISLNVTGSTLQAGYTIDVDPLKGERHFDDLVLSVRDASTNYDFIHRQDITVRPNDPKTFSDARSLPDGSYKAYVAYRDSATGNWVDLGPAKPFTVGPAPTPPPGGPWKLEFSDEFNDGTVNNDKWSRKYDRPGEAAYSNWNNGEAQWYKPRNVTESGGALNLTAKRESTRWRRPDGTYTRTYNYSSGMVTSRPSLNFRSGYIEAKVKLPKGSGFWPAFWTWPSDPRFGTPEIDIMEFWGDNTSLLYQIYHRQLAATDTRKIATATKVRHHGGDWTRSWHRVAADWEAGSSSRRGRIRWYVDGVLRKTEYDRADRAAYLITNLAVSNGRMGPRPTTSTPFPSSYRVDYIRVWKR